MAEYISREDAVSEGYLSDWYISSVGSESPVWTDEHISELINDFIVIPKDTKAADVQTVKHGRWENTNTPNQLRCSNCEIIHLIAQYPHGEIKYCPNCGARMDGEQV